MRYFSQRLHFMSECVRKKKINLDNNGSGSDDLDLDICCYDLE